MYWYPRQFKSMAILLMQGKYDVMAGLINHKVVFTPIVKAIVDDKKVDEDDLRVANILST